MMDETLRYLVNLSTFIILMFLIILVAYKLNGTNLKGAGIYRYAKVIEKVNINRDIYLVILKTGEDGCVLLVSPNNLEKIKELSKEEIEDIETKKKSNKFRFNKSNFMKVKFNKINFHKDVYNTMDLINKLKEKKNGDIK